VNKRFSLAAVCVTLLVAAPALGQEPPPNPNQAGYQAPPAKQAEHEFAVYARCVAARRYERARNAVLAPYGSAEQSEAASKVTLGVGDSCLRTGLGSVYMTIRPDVLVGGLGQALVLKDFPDLPAVIGAAVVDPAVEREQAAQLTPDERFGRCVVWRDPAAVHALLSADRYSREERQAVAELKEDMGYCLVEGSTLRINQAFLRNVTGIAAYRLAQQISPRGRKGASATVAPRPGGADA
jgi:hypothetical protein